MRQIMAVLTIITFSTKSEGIIRLSCGDPFLNQPLVCNCTNTENNNIEWLKGSGSLAICSSGGVCIGGAAGATFTTDFSAGYKYIFTINSYDYTSCGTYTCKDVTDFSTESYAAEVNVFDNTVPSALTEPAQDHTDGNIEITTSCLYKNSNIVLEWKYNQSGGIFDYKPDSPFRISTNCPATCNGNAAVTLRIGFPHTEYKGDNKIEVKFQLKVCHDKFPNACLERVTQHSYFIQGTATSTSTAIPITSPTSTTTNTTTHFVTSNTTSSTSTNTKTTATAGISTSKTTTASIKTATRTTNSTVPTQIVTQSEQDDSITVVFVVPSVLGGLFVIGVAVMVALVWKFRKNQTLHSNRSKHHKEGHSKKENIERHLKSHPAYSEYIPSHHHGFSAKELYGYKMYSKQSEIKRNPLYSHHSDRHMNMSYVTNSGQYRYDQLYNGDQFLVYQMQSAGADPLYTRRGHMIHPERRYRYSTNPRATTLRTQDNTIVTDYSWNWN